MSARYWLVMFPLIFAPAAAEAVAGLVEGLQMPAWMERGTTLQALSPGARLEQGDRLRTGASGRLLLRLAEGSHVKLGENARFHLREAEPAREEGGVFKGFLEVLKGAFRFTTTLVSRDQRREIDVAIAGVTAGIRGTDVWGKAAPDKDIVCLIEGEISVRRGADPPLRMSDPLSFYVAPKGKPALPVAPVDPDQLRRWAQQTELTEGQGIVRPDGGWTLALQSFRSPANASRALARVQDAGYAARVETARVRGEYWQRVVIPGLTSRAEAHGLAGRMEQALGIQGAWAYPSRE